VCMCLYVRESVCVREKDFARERECARARGRDRYRERSTKRVGGRQSVYLRTFVSADSVFHTCV